jgi:hypothetical protein
MEAVAPQTLFRCKRSDASPARQFLFLLFVGAVVGACGWLKYDRSLDWRHMVAYLGGGIVVFPPLGMLLMRNPTVAIEISDQGLTIQRKRRSLKFAWSEIEAARFQEYPVVNMHTSITCFLLRARGENFELTPEFDNELTEQAFTETMQDELESRGIPEVSKQLPSFEYQLSLGGAWVFALSIAGILIAHAMGYRTLGTVFGLGLLITGTALALMTHRQRLSKIVLVATVALILGTTAILWACHVNVREVLNQWEWVESRRPA